MTGNTDQKVANLEKISCLNNFLEVGNLLVTKKWMDICLHFSIYKARRFLMSNKFFKQNF